MIKKLITGAAIGGTGIAVWAGVAGIDHTRRDATGTIQASGDLGVFKTQLGDCMNDLPDLQENSAGVTVAKVVGVPCNTPHHFQIFFKGTLVRATFDIQLQRTDAEKICGDAIDSLSSTLPQEKLQEFKGAGLSDLLPTSTSWEKGDRVVDCLIGSATEFYSSSLLS